MLGFALLNFLFVFGAIYLLATLKAQQPEIGKMLSVMLPDLAGTGKTFLNFMLAQGTVTMILLAFAGSVLAGNDHRRGRQVAGDRFARQPDDNAPGVGAVS